MENSCEVERLRVKGTLRCQDEDVVYISFLLTSDTHLILMGTSFPENAKSSVLYQLVPYSDG